MELKQVYDEEIFNIILNLLNDEYGDKDYNQQRISKEYEELKTNKLILCVLYKDNQMIGHVSYHAPQQSDVACSILSVFINKEYRSQGYGKKMMALFEEHIKGYNLNQIILGARRRREPFYCSCGYQGEALLQGDSDKFEKQFFENFLKDNNIVFNRYEHRQQQIHQYFFDFNYIKDNFDIDEKIDKFDGLNLVVVFTKQI